MISVCLQELPKGGGLWSFCGERRFPFMFRSPRNTLVPQGSNITVHAGRLDRAQMAALFARERFALVVDATHPFAAEATGNIAYAAGETGIEVVRLVREEEGAVAEATYAASIAEAAERLKGTEGNILLTTGSKELLPFTEVPNYRERLYARVLPMQRSLAACEAAGIPPAHIIAMRTGVSNLRTGTGT